MTTSTVSRLSRPRSAENEDVGDRDIAYEDRDPYKVGLSDSGEYKDQTREGEYQVGEYKISDYDCQEYKSVYDK